MPNLEKLASEGMKFRNAYSGAPQCSPSRVCLQTGKPFYLQISHYAMHEGRECLPKTRQKYARHPDVQAYYKKVNKTPDKINRKQDPAIWLGMDENLDGRIGAVMQKIKDLGIEDNTYVVMTSDNGYRHSFNPHLTQPPHSAIVSGTRKVMHFYERPDIAMLFDLAADGGEVKNIAKEYPMEHKKLYDEMMRYIDHVGARKPKINPNYDEAVYKKAKEYSKRVMWGPFEGQRPLEEDE